MKKDTERTCQQFNDLITGLSSQVVQLATHSSGEGSRRSFGGPPNNQEGNFTFARFGTVEFPKFAGDDVSGWIYRCEQFFCVDSTNENAKVRIASIHLDGKALMWHQSYMKTLGEGVWPNWNEYKTAIVSRFGQTPYDDPLASLMKLKQDGTVEQYQDRFDALLTRVNMNVSQAISCFLSGLQPDIRNTVRMFKPSSIHDAYCLAKLQEATLATLQKKTKPLIEKPPYTRPTQNTGNQPRYNPYNSKSYSQTYTTQNFSRNPRTHRLKQQEIDEKRAKNLCFFHDEKYVPRHKCKGQVYRMEFVLMDEDNPEHISMTELDDREEEQEIINGTSFENIPQISLNALGGVNSYHTMRVNGKTKKNHPYTY